jgi:hypothetical protein
MLLIPVPVTAQENRTWWERTFVTVDAAFQPLSNDFSESLSLPDTSRRTENVTFAAGYGSTRGVLFDAGAGVRLANNLGVGLTMSSFRRSGSASFDLLVPNPLAANRPLDLPGSVTGLTRNEVGLHIQALYAVPVSKNVRVMLGGGPSVFNTKQDLVRSVEFETLPGFTSLKFDQALVTTRKQNVLGVNLSADVTWSLASHLGVGIVTRYSRAKVTLDSGSESGVSRKIELHAGGLQIGGGIRVLF